MNRISIISFTLAWILLFIPQLGFSANQKSYPGANCRYANGPDTNFFRFKNGILNASSGSRHVYCPIIRDRWKSTGYVNENYVDVRVDVNRYAGVSTPVTCTLFSYSHDGGIIDSHSKSFTGGGKGWISSLRVDPVASFGLYCNLPKYSTIYSYEVTENQSSDGVY